MGFIIDVINYVLYAQLNIIRFMKAIFIRKHVVLIAVIQYLELSSINKSSKRSHNQDQR